jgi:hypothetical protein
MFACFCALIRCREMDRFSFKEPYSVHRVFIVSERILSQETEGCTRKETPELRILGS